MDDITIGVTENVNNILVTAQPNDQIIDITVTETVETVLLDVSTTVEEVTVTATQNVIVENITVDYVNNENNIDINVTDSTQDVTLNITPTLVEINILRSGGEVNILQFDSLADFPATGSSDYFYLAKDTNKLYRWSGSAYVEISATGNPVWGQIIGTLSEQTDLQNALNLKAPINSPTFTGTVSGITKTMVGLGAVDNTSDLDKPISTATQTALNNKQPLDGDLTSIAALSGTFGLLKKTANNSYTIDTNTYLTSITSNDVTTALGFTPENAANKGVNNGYASLDGGGKVPSSQLPSYVDDVIEVSSFGTLPTTGETGKIYITLDTNKIYRWSGSVYVEVSPSTTVWGQITGTLSNQTDLQNALNAKQDDLNGTGFVKADGTTISYDNTTYYPASNPNGYTSNTGTVTSVALTVPSAFSVSGSPITSSGTLAVTATGNTTQYIAGDGSLVTFPTMSTAGTLIREVRNTTGATLTKGTVVYISGATGNKPTVSKALATGDSTSAQTFGLVQADIANNSNGNVVCAGDITGLDTSAFTEGAQLYLSSTTAGTYTTTKQLAPNHLVYIGVVTRAHPTLGQIEVNIQNGYELYELHDVSITSEANNQGLFYEASTDLWKNKSIATVLGYTPANGADYMALTGSQTISGDKTFSGAVINDGDLYLKQDATYIPKSGYTNLFASGKTININFGSTINAVLDFNPLSSDRTFSFPNTSGTIALTSDIPSLAGYVPTSRTITINGTTFDLSADRTYTISTSDATKLPLAGGTLTGALSGTTISLSGSSSTNALVVNQNSGFHALQVNQAGAGAGIGINQTGNTDGLLITHTGGRGIRINSANAGFGIIINNETASTSVPFVIQKSGADRISFTDAGAGTFNSTLTASQFIRSGGTSAQFLKADGSIDSSTYLTTSSASSTYLPLTGGTLTGALNGTSGTFTGNVSTTAQLRIESSGNAILLVGSRTGQTVFEIYNASNVLRFYNGTNEALKIDTGAGAATFSSSVTATSFIPTSSAVPTNGMYLSAANTLAFATNSTIDMTLTSTGNVGIGTISPSARLHVEVASESPATGAVALIARTSNGINDIFRWFDGATQLGVFKNSGNVGIGTTSPNRPLTISSTTADKIFLTGGTSQNGILLNSVGSSAQYYYGSGNNLLVGGDQGAVIAFNVSTSTAAIFFDSSNNLRFGATPTTERMRITSDGRLLVGTTTTYDARITCYGENSSSSNFTFRAVNTNGQGIFSVRNDGQFRTGDGPSSPYYLTVTGRAIFSDSTGVLGYVASVREAKTNINSLENVSWIYDLNPVSFNYRKKDFDNNYTQEFNSEISYGLIADEVEKVNSDLVFYDNVKGKKQLRGVEYEKLVPALVKVVQELKAELDTLKNK